jgi:hypothetical protein
VRRGLCISPRALRPLREIFCVKKLLLRFTGDAKAWIGPAETVTITRSAALGLLLIAYIELLHSGLFQFEVSFLLFHICWFLVNKTIWAGKMVY